VKPYVQDRETRQLIKWLNGPEGRAWSYDTHAQGRYALKLFSLKEDYCDLMPEPPMWVDWGHYTPGGNRYVRPRTREDGTMPGWYWCAHG
jgi:hypothetical protein